MLRRDLVTLALGTAMILFSHHQATLALFCAYLANPRLGSKQSRATTVDKLGSTSRSEEHTSELQSLMRISYAVFCLKKNKKNQKRTPQHKNDRQQQNNIKYAHVDCITTQRNK